MRPYCLRCWFFSVGTSAAFTAALLLLVAWTPLQAAAPGQTPSLPASGTVNTNANLRAGPGTSYAKVGSAAAGQAVQVTACDNGCTWFKLSSGDWVLAELVTVDATPATPATSAGAGSVVPVTPAVNQAYAVVTADLLNVRSQPQAGAQAVDALALGACVEVLALQPDWAQVQLSANQTGWCARDYLALTSACPAPQPVPTSAPKPAATATPKPATPSRSTGIGSLGGSSSGSGGGSSYSACCKVCTGSQACGDSCISRNKSCHKAPGCACNG